MKGWQGVCGVVGLVLLLSMSSATAAEYTKDSLKTVKKNVDDGKAVLVDVREKAEWDKGHIEGAILLPLSELKSGLSAEQLAKRLPKDKALYTHCASGIRSLIAAPYLEKQKWDLRTLKPGYKELLDAGFKKAK